MMAGILVALGMFGLGAIGLLILWIVSPNDPKPFYKRKFLHEPVGDYYLAIEWGGNDKFLEYYVSIEHVDVDYRFTIIDDVYFDNKKEAKNFFKEIKRLYKDGEWFTDYHFTKTIISKMHNKGGYR